LSVLAGGEENILKIERSDTEPVLVTRLVSSEDSVVPIYAWYDG